MKQRGLFIAVGLLLLVNAVVLSGVAYNRSGEPDAVMTLTERELPLVSRYSQKENSGVSLQIDTAHNLYWGRKAGKFNAFEWLDMKKLESLGFKPENKEEKDDYYNRQLPRRTFAVLEFGGTAGATWEKILTEDLLFLDQEGKEGKKTAQELATERGNIERELKTGSRLFIIDAGNNPALLRSNYADRSHYLIVPATVNVSHYGSNASSDAGKSSIRGNISLLINEVNVPHHLHKKFASESSPGYEVSLKTGKRYEPWIANIVSKPKE